MLKEAVESSITIESFEPFEISWLLQFIYGLGKDMHTIRPPSVTVHSPNQAVLTYISSSGIEVETAKNTNPSKSFLATCALLYSIGDFFCIDKLSWAAFDQLRDRLKVLLLQTRCASTMLEKIEFLPDLEAGIRAAWRHDRNPSLVRKDLVSLCVGIHPFVKDHESFFSLLEEMPEFTMCYLRALLGCPGSQHIESHAPRETFCFLCRKPIFDSSGALVSSKAYVWTPTSLCFWDNWPAWYCSRVCYNKGVSKMVV